MSQSTPTLYCLKCGYNLTGNATNSCPECGVAFDPVRLQTDIAKLVGITAWRVFFQVFIPATVLAVVLVATLSAVILTEGFGNRLSEEVLAALFLVLGIPTVIFLIYNNWKFSHRLAFRRMIRSDAAFTPSRLRNFRLTCCAVLLSGQAILGGFLLASGCFGVILLVLWQGGGIH